MYASKLIRIDLPSNAMAEILESWNSTELRILTCPANTRDKLREHESNETRGQVLAAAVVRCRLFDPFERFAL